MSVNMTVKRPSALLLLSEPYRGLIDLGAYFTFNRLLKDAPRGDGHPVLVLPGFLTTDLSTVLIRRFLGQLGYSPLPWKLGLNLGQYEDPADIFPRIEAITDEYGQRVSLVGWSLGGVYAREIARRYPSSVRQVITLGSPFGGITEDNNARWIYEWIHQKKVTEIDDALVKDILKAPPVPSTSIYTRWDGIVSWKHCIEQELTPITQNVEILGSSHIGLGHAPATLLCMADRLATSVNDWQKFVPKGWQKRLYVNC